MATDMKVQLLVELRDLASDGLRKLSTEGKNAGDSVASGAKNASSSLNFFRSGVTAAAGALSALGVSLSIGALIQAFTSANTELERLYDLSQKTGIEVGKLAGYKFAAGQMGTDIEAIIQSFKRISVSIVEARDPLSDSATMFNALGLSLEEMKKARPEDAFFAIAEALGKQGSEADKNVIAQQLLGRSYQDLKVIVAAGREEFNALVSEQELLNPVTKDNAQAADELGDAWGRVKEAINGLMSSDGATKSKGFFSSILDETTATITSLRRLWSGVHDGPTGKMPSPSEWSSNKNGNALFGDEPSVDKVAELKKAADEQSRIDLDAAKKSQARAIETAAAAKQAQESITRFIASETAKRDALSVEGLARMTEREIAEWLAMLDKKLITASQFEQAVLFIKENGVAASNALIEKATAEENKKKQDAFKGFMELEVQAQNELNAARKAIDEERKQNAQRAAEVYEQTTVAGVERALAREIAALESSGAAWVEIQAAKVAATEAAATQIDEINMRTAERTDSVLAGVKQGIMDYQKSLGTSFTRARDISKQAIGSIQSGLADMIVSAQNSSDGVGNAFKEMALNVATAIQRMIAEMIAMQIVNAAMGGIGGLFGGGGSFQSGGIPFLKAGTSAVLGLANGTASAPGGWSWVGEKGPELVRLPMGSRVMPSGQSASMGRASEASAPPTIIQLTINAVDSRGVAELFMRPEAQNALKNTIRGAVRYDGQTRASVRGT
jgi:lambda family phage tail tape measure protein